MTVIESEPGRASERAAPSSPRARRLIGDFFTIVAGVTVALAAQSLWDNWQDVRTEQAYLAQLQSDLAENTARLQAAITLETQQHEGAQAAYRAVTAGESISRDSAIAWLITRRGVFYSDPRLLTGTITALVSTGDLRLLRDPALRQAVAAYAAQISDDRQEFNRFVDQMQPPFNALRNLGFENRRAIDVNVQFAPVVAAITGRPGTAALVALDGLIIANEIRTIYLRRMLDTTKRFRTLVDAEA